MYKTPIIILLLITLTLCGQLNPIYGFGGLAAHHCKNFNVEGVWRLATGRLSEVYGPRYKEFDAYIRSYVGYDNLDREYYEVVEDSEEEEEGEQEEEEETGQDEIVEEYSKGLKTCGLDLPPKEIYAIWRFVRMVLNNDYLYEWLRTEMRGMYGYEIHKPNAWMDGEQPTQRLRLQKLFSNDFLDQLQIMIFRDYLYPLMTTIKKNTVIATSTAFSKSSTPMLLQILQTRNYNPQIFYPVNLILAQKSVFAFTIPGLPLLLAGSTKELAWAFTGILVDRTNVETLQIAKMKYFDEEREKWVKVKNITEVIKVKGEEDYVHQVLWTEYGPLVNQPKQEGKHQEYYVRWRENEKKVRTIFSKMASLIANPTQKPQNIQYPFNSFVIINKQGIHMNLLPPEHPAYFIYPDLLGQSKELKSTWASNPRRGYFVVSNKHLSSMNPEGYLDREVFSTGEQILIDSLKRWKDNTKFTPLDFLKQIRSIQYDTQSRKILQNLLFIYRKAKFTYFPNQQIRKECDQLVALLDKWDYTMSHPLYSPLYKLWWYFTKKYTFNHISKSQLGKSLARYRAVTDTYFVSQIHLWKDVVGYGECDSHEYREIEKEVNHTGHNATCFYNVFRGINATRLFLREHGGLLETGLGRFSGKVMWELEGEEVTDPRFNDREMAFDNTYNENLVFVADLAGEVVYSHGLGELKSFNHDNVRIGNIDVTPDPASNDL